MTRLAAAAAIACTTLLLCTSIARAHAPSNSYLDLDATGGTIAGRWDIAITDLEYAVGLDADLDGAITWGEVQTRAPAIDAYVLAGLGLAVAAGPCPVKILHRSVAPHPDGPYLSFDFQTACATGLEIAVAYRLFADADASHRGLLSLNGPDATSHAVLNPDAPARSMRLASSGWREFVDFVHEGIVHIATGTDHVLFLLCLLMPAVMLRAPAPRGTVRRIRATLPAVAWIVTAFTVAHSITLALAVLGWVRLPSALVETAIAASIIYVAVGNLRSRKPRHSAAVAFAFGLVHGLGFATVLEGLISGSSPVLALFGFNLGVEIGQLAIVVAWIGLTCALAGTPAYRRVVVGAGSLAIGVVALVWLLERSYALVT
jgi:hypothetical protein